MRTHGVGQDGHEVVEDSGDLAKEGADPLCALGDVDVEEVLDGARVAQLVGHHRDVVEAVKVRQRLSVVLVLDELLGAAVQEADVRVRAEDLLAVELEDEAQHAVRCRVLRTKVELLQGEEPKGSASARGRRPSNVVAGNTHGKVAHGCVHACRTSVSKGTGKVPEALEDEGRRTARRAAIALIQDLVCRLLVKVLDGGVLSRARRAGCLGGQGASDARRSGGGGGGDGAGEPGEGAQRAGEHGCCALLGGEGSGRQVLGSAGAASGVWTRRKRGGQ